MLRIKFQIDKKLLLTAIAVAGVIIAGALILTSGSIKIGNFNIFNSLSPDAVAKKSIDYINANILTGSTKASLVSTSEESGLVKIKIKIGENEFDSYATKDGKLLFPDAFKLDEASTGATTDAAQE